MSLRDMTTSRAEILHLAGAIVGLSLVFAVALANGSFPDNILPSAWLLTVSAVAVTLAFLPHELAHKVAAQRYGLGAEFRGSWRALLLSLGIAVGTSMAFQDGRGLVFAAPGAVLIMGHVTERTHGIVSIVGPAMNLLIAAAAWPFAISLNPDSDPTAQLFHVVALVNALLAVFNLLPISPLDGRRVWWWNRGVYLVSLATAVSFFGALLFYLGEPVL